MISIMAAYHLNYQLFLQTNLLYQHYYKRKCITINGIPASLDIEGNYKINTVKNQLFFLNSRPLFSAEHSEPET